MRSVVVRGPLVFALVLGLVLGGSGAAASATASVQEEAPSTTIRISLAPDGDARFSVTMRFALATPNETRAFDRLAREFERGETAVHSVEPFERAAERAAASTGRDMAILNVSRTASRTNGTGALRLSFTWTAFARTPDDRIELGDVFETRTGTWLPVLEAGQELVIEFPDRYRVVSSSRGLTNGTFHISGPEEFDAGEPWATLARQGPGEGTTGLGNRTVTRTALFGISPTVGVGLLVVLVAGGSAVLLARRRSTGTGTTAASDGGPTPPGGDEAAGEIPDGAEPTQLLSDEERVLRLLSANDGRMKQAAIVSETDWSNAKVSQLLSEMAERDQIEKLRIGRENLISLPDRSPDESE